MNKTIHKHIFILTITSICFCVLNSCNGTNKQIEKLNKILKINTDTLTTDIYPSIYSIFGTELPFSYDKDISICYVADARCSICLYSALQFIEDYLNSKWKRPLTLFVKGDMHLFKHYYKNLGLNNSKIFIIEATSENEYLQNGAYIIFNNHILKVLPENNRI